MDLNKFYERAYDWMLTVGPKIILGIFLLFIGFWLIRIFRGWLTRRMSRKDIHSSVRPFMVSLIITTLQILVVVLFMQVVGLQMTIFATLIGAFGVAAGLALSGTLQNFTSGIIILFLKPFRLGDNIIAQGQEGTIASIQIFFTVMKTFDNRTVIIPNSKLSNEVIVNLSREGKRRMDFELKLGFGVDYQQVQSIISNSIDQEAGLLKDPEPRIGISSIELDGYKVQVNVWAPSHGYVDARLVLLQRIVEDLKAAGVKLPGME
jgi:small conductance mechanosensitive channel